MTSLSFALAHVCLCELSNFPAPIQGAPAHPSRCHVRRPSSRKPFWPSPCSGWPVLNELCANIYRSVSSTQTLSPRQGQGLSLVLIPSTQGMCAPPKCAPSPGQQPAQDGVAPRRLQKSWLRLGGAPEACLPFGLQKGLVTVLLHCSQCI